MRDLCRALDYLFSIPPISLIRIRCEFFCLECNQQWMTLLRSIDLFLSLRQHQILKYLESNTWKQYWKINVSFSFYLLHYARKLSIETFVCTALKTKINERHISRKSYQYWSLSLSISTLASFYCLIEIDLRSQTENMCIQIKQYHFNV